MKLSRVDVRFFRSFNYDYELKAREGSEPASWEDADPAWFPFVKVQLDSEVTAIVGANEAGKSQLLTAIKAALSGTPIERADFCRYSERYSAKTNEIRLPEFGGTFTLEPGEPNLDPSTGLADVREFTLYRPGSGAPFVVANNLRIEMSPSAISALVPLLPSFHELRTDLAIPNSVSIAELAGEERHRMHDRKQRTGLLAELSALAAPTAEAVAAKLVPRLVAAEDEASIEAESKRRAEFELARQLLVDAAGIDQSMFVELREAIRSGREGQVEGIVGIMNSAIKENLNIQRWWTQDRDFDLLVEAREQELAFTIRDRTNSKYSFDERSQGLRFFLSYFVQLTAHRLKNVKADILLLDEPDAFLSSIGQQDLLRVLHDYAMPEDATPRSQVVYVTHSPFLIDKNAPHRIRVLDKGSEDEGTRVVRDAANNRYEPLRSSLGAHVAETAFIGGQNLFVEGIADQILIAGVSAQINRREQSTAGALDLNAVTVVAAGGADAIPYMVYLARGRDTVKPPCVALLDGDASGRDAERVLKRGEARKKRVLLDEYIVRLDLWAADSGLEFEPNVTVEEIEDLLPVEVAHRASLNYLARFNDLGTVDTSKFTPATIRAGLEAEGVGIWDALDAAYRTAFTDDHLEKAGLAREVVSLLALEPDIEGGDDVRQRFGALLRHLAERLDLASDDEERSRTDDRLKRAIKNFTRNHPSGMRKHDAKKLLREIEASLGASEFGDEVRPRVHRIAREFELTDSTSPNVPRFPQFREEIKSLNSSERIAYQDDALSDPVGAIYLDASVDGDN
ncbi:hypothetical protein HMPREF0063_12866 [Aeromicrobium marinum DSM 15272]|uniref:Rad50/SbcC-type AAA domain-containing protein n=1 Tax=Aeromicrobium marinum DSM 15272 TaxID=585531 RepID=E2SFQ7_9ACTN|nr:AAA family ATPase [Aeromicrobium marinum]EFQ82024.1 hypothetical protein HMPREF0063_12866 [Aeromicrobium marinum DSM 15272]